MCVGDTSALCSPAPVLLQQFKQGCLRSVCDVFSGVSGGLYRGTNGGGLRESHRQLLMATLSPYASIIKGEFDAKIGYGVSLDFRRLAAADIAAQARAYGTLMASGVENEEASEVAGLSL